MFDSGFSKLLIYKNREGDCFVPRKHQEDGFNLGYWVSNLRKKGPDNNDNENLQRLDAIGFVWDALNEAWEKGFSHLLQFHESEGSCRVPSSFKRDGFSLGEWVSTQRAFKNRLTPDLKQRLSDIGFVWDPFEKAWEEGFNKLLQFKGVEGHCVVPARFKLEGFYLGYWVMGQRARKEKLPSERKQRLDDISFVWDARKGKI